MPRGDGTGPMGMGSMTGRGAGYCAGFNTPGFANPAPRMGMAFRRGVGFGRGRGRGQVFGNYEQKVDSYPVQPPQSMARAGPQTLQSAHIAQQPGGNQLSPVQPSQQSTPQNSSIQQATTQGVPYFSPQPQTTQQTPKEQEINILEEQLGALVSQVNQIKDSIDQLKSQYK